MSIRDQVPGPHPSGVLPEDTGLDRVTRLFIGCLAALGGTLLLWWLFAHVFVPELIRLAYEGKTVPGLSGLMSGRESTPLAEYLETWEGFRRRAAAPLMVLPLVSIPLAFTLPAVTGRLGRGTRASGMSERSVGLWLGAGLLVLVGSIHSLVYLDPVAFVYAVTEDGWIEHGTFVAFAMAGCLFLWTAILEPDLRKLGALATAVAALVVGLDEISWGQRILGFQTPDVLQTVNAQREVSLHNVWFPTHGVIAVLVLTLAVGLPLLERRWGRLGRWVARLGIPTPPVSLWPAFLLTAGVLGFSMVDPPYAKMDEIGELALGICVLLLGLHAAIRAGTGRSPGARVILPSGLGSLLAVGLATAGMVYWASSPASVSYSLDEFATYRFPDGGLHGQAEELFRFMERRPEFHTVGTRIEYGRFLAERGERDLARTVLELALREQRRIVEESAARRTVAVMRNEVEIYTLLGRRAEAEEALRQALAADETTLETAAGTSEEADIHWSMAQTLEASGRLEAALGHAATACELTDERHLRRWIRRWASRSHGVRLAACDWTSIAG